jgi:hypothetical protein
LSAHKIGLLLALYVGVNLVSGQSAIAAPDTNPIGKVLVTTGTVRIEHPSEVTAQANLPLHRFTQCANGSKRICL